MRASYYENDSYWSRLKKNIPLRYNDPASYPEDDSRHWYDFEYTGWNVEKVNIPSSPKDGIKNKKIHYFLPGTHPYIDEYSSALCDLAAAYNAKLTTFNAGWKHELQKLHVEESLKNPPDMMVILPVNAEKSTELYKRVNSEGVPVVAANFIPSDEGFKYVIAWSGPDDWYQFRLLSRKFAMLSGYESGYCIMRHVPGTSSYYARTYSVITELKSIAPKMKLLDMQYVEIGNKSDAKSLTINWIKKFGKNLNGIVSADDSLMQIGINEALFETGRHDIIRVAAGSSNNGMELVRKGKIHAITFQSPSIDASTSFKLISDWFEGLLIEPIRYLPVNIITIDNVDDFANLELSLESINPYEIYVSILSHNKEEVNDFFEELFNKVIHTKQLSREYLNGFLMEIAAVILRIIRENDLDVSKLFGNYEYLYKFLFNQVSYLNSILWLEKLSNKVLDMLRDDETKNKKLVDTLIHYVSNNYSQPMSLKILSSKYHKGAGYLGQLIRKEVGESFTEYLNRLRIEKAKELLKNTSMSVRTISTKVGFENPDYFYYVFKKYSGVFPSQFIKQ